MKGRAVYISAAFLVVSFVVYFQLFQDRERNERLVAWMRTNGTTGIWNDVIPESLTKFSYGDRNPESSSIEPDLKPVAEEERNTTEVHLPILVDNLFDVQNDTLGVQEVFLVSLNTRRDKHDAFAVQAMASNITYTPVEGVMGDQVPEKALPYTMHLEPAEIGCWRAHMNIFEAIIERKIATAIIFEDDADWDVSLKHQLVQYARGTRFITGSEPNGSFVPHSPYGEDWDVLWIGDCSTRDWPGDNKRFVIPHDPTVLPLKHRKENERPEMRYWDRDGADYKTRIVYRAATASCTAAYAISLKGAQKAIYHLSMNPNNQPIDNGMGRLCENAEANFRCMSTNPTLVGISKPAGSTDRGSDVGHAPSEAHDETTARSERVMYSTRLNLPNLLSGNTTMISQHPDHSPHMDITEIGSAVGYRYEITADEIEELKQFDQAKKKEQEKLKLQEEGEKLEKEREKLREEEQQLDLNAMELAEKIKETLEDERKEREKQEAALYAGSPEDVATDDAPTSPSDKDGNVDYASPPPGKFHEHGMDHGAHLHHGHEEHRVNHHSPAYEAEAPAAHPDFGAVVGALDEAAD